MMTALPYLFCLLYPFGEVTLKEVISALSSRK